MIELANILRKYGTDYLLQYKDRIPQNHLKVINDILVCRRKENGGRTYYCKHCNKYIYSYHSCGNRNCNKCQNELADLWLEKSKKLLLNVHHFLATFTLPDTLRRICRSNQRLIYDLLFKSAAHSIQHIAYDTKYMGGKPGMIAVLHSWSRNLSYHPHVHILVTGGGLFEDENIWMNAKEDFLIPVKALSKIFKAKFRDLLKKENIDIFKQIHKNVWQDKWVVHCKPVGNGEKTVIYLARYIFRTAISNTNINSLNKGQVKFRFKNAQNNQWQVMAVSALEFIHRYPQHVLPKGFVKVRYYGLYAHAYRKKLGKVPLKCRKKSTIETLNSKNHCCPKCHNPLILIEDFGKMHFYSNGPPKREVLLGAIKQKLDSRILCNI